MSLQQILEKIKSVQPFANENVDEGPIETLAGRRARQRQAKEELKSLTESYRQELLKSAVFILVTGPERDNFVKIANEELKFFSADPDAFYMDLVNRISPQLYAGKPSNSNLLDVLTRHLEDKAMEVGILGYPMVTFKQEYRRMINDREDFLDLVKEIINGQVGSEVAGVQAAKLILNDAIKAGHSANTTPILMSVEDESEAATLSVGLRRLSGKVVTVSATEANSKSVAQKMKEVRAQLYGKTLVEDETPEFTDSLELAPELSVDEVVEQVAAETSSKGNRRNNKNKNKDT